MPIECNDDGTWSYRPRPKARPPEETTAPTPTSTTGGLGEALLEPTAEVKVGPEGEEEEEEVDKKGLLISFLVLCLSIPALIGAWCWPALVIGLVSGTVSATARTLGHVISFWITLALMLLVFGVLGKEAFFGPRSWAPWKTRFGPLMVFSFAALLIMAEPSRHLLTDANLWPWCGNNPSFDRINETSGWAPQCDWSATQYKCSQACCVSTWLPNGNATVGAPTASTVEYFWAPPSADFNSGADGDALAIPGPFLTIRPDDSLFTPKGFYEVASMPYMAYESPASAPLTFFETGAVNPLRQKRKTAADCPVYGVNEATGYCYLTNISLPYEEQLAQLGQWGAPLANPDLPFNKTSNSYECSCGGCVPSETMSHLSTVGVIFTIVFTYVGFILLAIAVGWNANIISKFGKIKTQWRKLRGAYKKSALTQPEITPPLAAA